MYTAPWTATFPEDAAVDGEPIGSRSQYCREGWGLDLYGCLTFTRCKMCTVQLVGYNCKLSEQCADEFLSGGVMNAER